MKNKKKQKTVDSDGSVTQPAAREANQVEETSVSDSSENKPVVVELDDIDAFDPSATHVDLSEDDNFDDEDESY